MRLGIVTPVVNRNPRFDPPPWESNAGIDEIVTVCRAAEKAGYAFASCPEHVLIPGKVAATRGGCYWDPAVTLSFVAAATSTLGLLTHVLVLGYHHPLEVVKRYGTLDVASGGRMILGVGVGTLRPEFEVLDVPYGDRGARADDAMAAIAASFGKQAPSYQGRFYEFDDVIIDPCGQPRHLEMWVGGSTRRSLRRAVELGDGWIPFGLKLPALQELLADDELGARRAERPGFEVVLAPEPPLDPMTEPSATEETVAAYAAAGATALHVRFRHESMAHYIEQLSALAVLVDTPAG